MAFSSFFVGSQEKKGALQGNDSKSHAYMVKFILKSSGLVFRFKNRQDDGHT